MIPVSVESWTLTFILYISKYVEVSENLVLGRVNCHFKVRDAIIHGHCRAIYR